MRVADTPDFDFEHPELFKWCFLDSKLSASVAMKLAEQIAYEQMMLAPKDRILLPGMRHALNVIAQHATV